MERLSRYDWPGNIPELENILERSVILSNGPTLEVEQTVFSSATGVLHPVVPPSKPQESDDNSGADRVTPTPSLESLESSTRSHILAALEESRWVIDGPHGAAKILALNPNALRSRMKKLGIVKAAAEGQP